MTYLQYMLLSRFVLHKLKNMFIIYAEQYPWVRRSLYLLPVQKDNTDND